MSKDYYKILGIEKNASQDEVKKAFYKLAHQHHPDKAGGNEIKFKEINEAYQVVGNPEKRKQYDQFGATFDQQGGFGGGMNWEDFMRSARQGGASVGGDFGDLFSGLEDLFGGFGFSSRQGRQGRASGSGGGADIHAKMTIDFREAIFGTEKTIELYKNVACQKCNGSGAEPGSRVITCQACGGQGQVGHVQHTIFGAFQTAAVCPHCQGEGRKAEKHCSHCKGQGISKEIERITVKIPAGIDNGQTIRLNGKGEAGKRQKAGDLYLTININPDRYFQREGNDISSKIDINFTQAALGDKVEVETLEGPVQLKIPAGTKSGQVFRLRDRGVPDLHGRHRGDQLVTVEVAIPHKLTKNQKKLLEELNREGL